MRDAERSSSDGLSPAVIQSLLNVGVTQSGIADMFDVSRQAVHDMCKRYSLKRQTRQELLQDVWPWEVSAEMGNQAPFKVLRDHGEWVLTRGRGVRGKGLTEDRKQRLRSFYQRLRDGKLVLEFDPSIPPEPGVQNKGGFRYTKRRRSDGDLLIRVNQYTNITEQGKKIWTFPEQEP